MTPPQSSPRTAWVRFHCATSASSAGDGPASPPRVATFRWAGEEWRLTSVDDDAPGAPASAGALPVTGPFGRSSEYRGCPGCGNDSYVRCGRCGGLGCWRSSDPIFRCGACGHRGPVSGTIESLGALDAG